MRWIFFVVFLFPLSLKAVDAPQPIVVPRVVKFAGIRLKFTRGAYKRVQEKVNQLTRSQRSFNQILERTHLFFPLIERILADENVPDDFKFQAVHESTLIGNAVSHTHDVGFWQIQKATALGLKLTIDNLVDERMHLIESTKAAARFLKPHNQYFDSWLGALLAYNRGRAGAVKIFPKKWYGVKTVRLDDKTDNYIISVIATKIAFAKVAGKEKHPKMQLFLYTEGHHGQRLGDIATHLKIEEKLLYEHNQWLRTAVVPHNTKCCLVVPFLHTHAHMHVVLKQTKPLKMALPAKQSTGPTTEQPIQLHHVNYGKYLKAAQKNLVITAAHNAASTRLIKANGKMAVVAKEGDTIADLAKLGKIDLEKFLLINEVKKNHGLIPGAIYYFNLKSSKGGAHYHVVASGEGIWDIAQRYGMKQAALLEKNRMSQSEPLDTGRILWLRFIRPRKIPVEYYDVGSL